MVLNSALRSLSRYCRRQRAGALSFGDSRVHLTEVEQSYNLLIAPAVSTINIYEGELPVQTIRQRVVEIMQANPWLGARLLTTTEDGCDMFYHAQLTPAECAEYMVSLDMDCLDPDDYRSLVSNPALARLLCRAGNDVMDDVNEQQFRIIFVQERGGSRSALVMSMSHLLGDGDTFYDVFKQLDPTQPVRSLNVKRSQEAIDSIQRTADMSWFLSPSAAWIAGMLINLLRTLLISLIWPKSMAVQRIDLVDELSVSKAKQEGMDRASAALTPVPFLSTHDVVASDFYRSMCFDGCLFVVNMRGRASGVGRTLAGNYDAIVALPLAEARRPEGIRRSLGPLRSPDGQRPTNFSVREGFSIVTNWATFYHELDSFAGCRLLAHMPIFLPQWLPMRTAALCLFRKNKHELAVYTNLAADLDQRWRQGATCIKK